MTNQSVRYVVKISAARMPTGCWGTYEHVALLRVTHGRTVRVIRTCAGQEIIDYESKLFRGKSLRCAAAKAEARMRARAAELNAAL